MVYSSRIKAKDYTFGVSGRLYKSNVLIYDHQTESLWSQLKETAIAGPMAGTRLQKIAAQRTSWKKWRSRHPDTLVLSTETGFRRDYDIDPYKGYYRALGTMFPVGEVRTDLPAKAMVLGLEINGAAKAYPLSQLKKNATTLSDEINGTAIKIVLSADGQVTQVLDEQSQPISAVFAYWFAWQAFHPQTSVYGKGH